MTTGASLKVIFNCSSAEYLQCRCIRSFQQIQVQAEELALTGTLRLMNKPSSSTEVREEEDGAKLI